MTGCTVMHEHFRAMNVVKVEHVLYQDLQVDFGIHLFVVGEKVQASLAFFPEKHLQTITDCGCLTVGTVCGGSKRSDDLGRRTVVDPILKTWKLLSLENITFLHYSVVQCEYFFANASRFVFIFLVIRVFFGRFTTWKIQVFLKTMLDCTDLHMLQ